MLAIVSDLHFQHTSEDVLRFRSGEEVHELRIDRNLTADAIGRLCEVIDESVRRRGGRELEVVFAGDIFELHRTPVWLSGDLPELRPTAAPGPDTPGEPLRDRIHRVLDLIEAECGECFSAWAEFARHGRYRRGKEVRSLPPHVRVVAHYLPGNHDRLANAWPSVRARVRGLLAIDGEPPGAPFPHLLERPLGDGSGYGVRVRHGHEYDPWNFGRDVTQGAALGASEEAYLLPSFGDFLTVDVATRLAVGFRARYARELRSPDLRGQAMRRLYAALTEFDDVRPFTLLMSYLTQAFGQGDEETFETLRPLLRDIAAAAAADPFFRSECERLELPNLLLSVLGQALESAPLGLLGRAVELAARLAGRPEALELGAGAPPAEVACFEPGLGEGDIDCIVAGHTHWPDQVPLPSKRRSALEGRTREEGLFFLDSGTWRTTVRSGAGRCFGRLRTCTVVLAYNEAERRGGGDAQEGRRFETWTGHLATGAVGPRLVKRQRSGLALQRLAFTRLEVLELDEGRAHDGAELRAWCGVDDQARELRLDGLRSGESQPLDFLPTLPLEPDLDGELWFHGVEADLGTFPLDRDDLLPWASLRLRREGDRFAPGEGRLWIQRARSTRMALWYRVE